MHGPADIDQLYQLPLDEFTAARNALAKTSGKGAAEIRALVKPPVAAWAVNQLYWKDRGSWDALVDAALNLRRVNKSVLSGGKGDVRAAGKAHDDAVHDALKATLALLEQAGQPATDATRQAVVNTLRALPSEDAPGRLTRVLQPGGFEMLAGFSVAAPARKHGRDATDAKEHAKETKNSTQEHARSKADVKALTRARETAAAAQRALNEAEHAVRRHEFEIARATRDEERATRTVAQARAALDEATAALTAAEREHADAVKRRKISEDAAKKGEALVAAARRQAESAAAALKKVSQG